MAEYIERHKVLAAIQSRKSPTRSSAQNEMLRTIRVDVNHIPAADVVEVKHGRWDDSLDGITPYCTICGRSHRGMQRTPNYCPNCGARMDGEG